MPMVSVIIPAYNADGFIADALESICAQTLRDAEVVVVDDGSTDRTIATVEQFANRLRLALIRQPNTGPAAARNAGIRRAAGQYCAFLDADDVMLPDRLAEQAAVLDANPGVGLVHTDLMTFDDRGVIHRTRHAFSDPCGGMILERLLLDNFITTSTVMARKQCLIEAGLFGENRRVSEDFELWLRMAAQWEVAFVDRPLVQYRRRRGSLSADKLHTARCALDVVETFWREHPDLRSREPQLYRRSVAGHLATAASAALAGGRRPLAMAYVVRSLALDPWKGRSWKSLAKTLLPPRVPSRDALMGTGSR